jgi:hypothetical protein
MQRSSIIATVVATTGILIAGSVASVAVINAASSTQPDAQSVALVSADGPTAAPAVPSEPAAPAAAAPASEAPAPQGQPAGTLTPIASDDLPALPAVEDAAPVVAPVVTAPRVQSGQTTQTAQVAPHAAKPAQSGANSQDKPRKPKKPSAAPTASSAAAPAQPTVTLIDADRARSIVMQQGDGVRVVSTNEETHGGYDTYAVKIARASGEVITGYVDRASGVVIDWVVNEQPPAPAQPAAGSSGGSTSTSKGDDDGSDDSHEGSDDSGSGSDDSNHGGEGDDD